MDISFAGKRALVTGAGKGKRVHVKAAVLQHRIPIPISMATEKNISSTISVLVQLSASQSNLRLSYFLLLPTCCTRVALAPLCSSFAMFAS